MISFDAKTYLDSLVNYEKQTLPSDSSLFKLDRINLLLDILGRPQQSYKIIHVAGSNGKGSTCAMIASILSKAGHNVGLYTSPHFRNLNERIRILNACQDIAFYEFSGSIDNDDLNYIIKDIKQKIDQLCEQKKCGPFTYFEVLTVAALCYFQLKKVELAILETGLGGRLDATNAVDSHIACITPISLEHTQVLGKTLEQITQEKAAIIKNRNQKVVCAPQPPEVLKVIEQRCQDFGIHARFVEENRTLKSSLVGRHQNVNAAVAVGVIHVLQDDQTPIDERAVQDGLAQVVWPGRFEVIHSRPKIILDCAHNPASAKALAMAVKENFPDQKVTLLCGISSDKNVREFCRALDSVCEKVIMTKADHPRALDPNDVNWQNYFNNKNINVAKNLEQAWGLAHRITREEDMILITGSLFIVSEARERCTNIKV